MKKSKVYTRTGDAGKTSLVGGTKVLKSEAQIAAYGNIDELNSHIGYLRSVMPTAHEEHPFLQELQNELFVLGSLVATESDKRELFKLPKLKFELVSKMEQRIDEIDSELEPLKNFIIPMGGQASTYTHVVRTVCRRTERSLVALPEELIPAGAILLLNRLSDYFFVLARRFNAGEGHTDVLWVP